MVVKPVTHVRDVPDGPYAAQAVLDQHSLESVCEVNLLFLERVAAGGAARAGGEVLGLAAGTAARIRDLDPAGRVAVADCPYTLFDLRFKDAAFWRCVTRDSGLRTLGSLAEDASFARTAVYLAWYLAQGDDLAAALALGMTPEARRAWRGIRLAALDRVALAALPHLAARWGRHAIFWPKLLDAAASAGRERAAAVRLLGLQLLAADALKT
jgi:hypothetical protein